MNKLNMAVSPDADRSWRWQQWKRQINVRSNQDAVDEAIGRLVAWLPKLSGQESALVVRLFWRWNRIRRYSFERIPIIQPITPKEQSDINDPLPVFIEMIEWHLRLEKR